MIKNYIFILFVALSQGALVNWPPEISDSTSVERGTVHSIGLNENLHLLGLYTVKLRISQLTDSFERFETNHRKIYFHMGTTYLIFGGIGLSVKQYLFNKSKYNQNSLFSSLRSNFFPFLSYSLSYAYILPFCAEDSDCDIFQFDFHSIATGLDVKFVKYNNLNLNGTLGIAYFFSISEPAQAESLGPWPAIKLSVTY